MRGRAVVVAAGLVASAAAIGGTAAAQSPASIVVTPANADPGGVVQVSNAALSPCMPPRGTASPSASVDLYVSGTATPVNRAPYQGGVSAAGTWTVEVRLDPDLPPGKYRVQAGCYTDSGLNADFGPKYDPGQLDLRLQEPGQPSANPAQGRPGDTIQVGSGDARCPPPAGSPSPRVRVSLLGADKATRAEAEGPVDPASGRWNVGLRVPDLGPQATDVTAVCLARIGAPSPYARYRTTSFAVEAVPAPTSTTAVATTTPPPTTAPRPGVPGASTTVPRVTTTSPALTTMLPPSPIATAVVAEPTYTG